MPRAVKRSLPLLALLAAAPLLVPVESSRSAPAPVAAPKKLTNSIKMKLVRIPAGKFMMGSPNDEKERQNNEGPRHEVEITKAFYLGAYEVTQAQYKKVIGKNPSAFSATGSHAHQVRGVVTDDFPVDTVSLQDAVDFCKKLSALPAEKGARRVYRIPSEAEWEYACRAGTTTAFHFGATLATTQANAGGTQNRPVRVGSYKPNAWGLYDMHGNVWEWVADWHDPNYYTRSPKKDPLNTNPSGTRLVRGGAWTHTTGWARSAIRGQIHGGSGSYYHIGFRVACTVGGSR
jgi:formylglycine-generating enzyme required for sulfatase activity